MYLLTLYVQVYPHKVWLKDNRVFYRDDLRGLI